MTDTTTGWIDRFWMKLSGERWRDGLVGILSHFPYRVNRFLADLYIRRQRGRFGKPSAPSGVFFFVTNLCNQNCRHCFYAAETARPSPLLGMAEIETLCRSFDGNVRSLVLCGGEPTTRKDLPDIARCLVEVGRVQSLVITSNGFLQERLLQAIDRTLESRRKFELRVAISLDGVAAVHDAIRNTPGAFDRAVSTLKALEARSRTDSRLIPVINAVIQKANASTFMEFYKMARHTFSSELAFTLVRQDGRDAGGLDRSLLLDAGGNEDLLPDRQTCERLLQEIQDYEFGCGLSKGLIVWRSMVREYHLRIVREKRALVRCVFPESNATISPSGGVSLCEVVKPFANLKDFEYDLIRCWNSPAATAQRRQLSCCWCTYPCGLGGSMLWDPGVIATVLREVRRRRKQFETRKDTE